MSGSMCRDVVQGGLIKINNLKMWKYENVKIKRSVRDKGASDRV